MYLKLLGGNVIATLFSLVYAAVTHMLSEFLKG